MDKLIPIWRFVRCRYNRLYFKIFRTWYIRSRYEFTVEYRNKFINFLNELFQKRSFNQQLYYELTGKVKEMQYELGSDGVYAYVKDNLKGYSTSNYQALVKFLA